MKYCPNCGAEYRAGFDECADCLVPLVDDAPLLTPRQIRALPTAADRVIVFRSGRRIDAELVRSRLEADGLEARIWSSGLGPWRMESAITEISGVPSDFNAHNVTVDPDDLDRAVEILGQDEPEESAIPIDADEPEGFGGWMTFFRHRWVIVIFAGFLVYLLLLFGGPE